MEFLLMTLAACGMAAIAAYAQFRIPRFTTSERKVLLTRGVLITVGAALGYLSARSFPNDPFLALLAFMTGFGVVHFPAAFILFCKTGAWKRQVLTTTTDADRTQGYHYTKIKLP